MTSNDIPNSSPELAAASHKPPVAAQPISDALPITSVALYTSGVGYFERRGQVDGSVSLSMTLRSEEINDVLKSLVVLDAGGGRVAPVTYPARDSVQRQIDRASAFMARNLDREELWTELRGAEVRVTADTGEATDGRVFGVETRETEAPLNGATVEECLLTVLTGEGALHAFSLDRVQSVALLDAGLRERAAEALGLAVQRRDVDRTSLVLGLQGEERRGVLVGHIAATPLWQCSYRLVLGDEPLLQGWATVQNTGDEDWTDVRLRLVSGRPISFVQDLYSPVYVDRPKVAPRVADAPGPQVYGASPPVPAGSSRKRGIQGRPMYLAQAYEDVDAEETDAADNAGFQKVASGADGIDNAALANGSAALGAALGSALFSYEIAEPVTVPRRESAMIAFLSSGVDAERVSVYDPRVLADHPLSGARLRNSSGLHLMGGPVTVFDRGDAALASATYVGEAVIDDTEPGQQRLFTYAVDLAVACTVDEGEDQVVSSLLSASSGALRLTVKLLTLTTFQFTSYSDEPRAIVLDVARDSRYRLVEPAEATETLPKRYRFDIPLAPREALTFTLREERETGRSVDLLDETEGQIGYLLQTSAGGTTPPLTDALRAVVDAKAVLSAHRSEAKSLERETGEITTEQERLRKNLQAVEKSPALYKRYADDLNALEDRLQRLRGERQAVLSQIDSDVAEIRRLIDAIEEE